MHITPRVVHKFSKTFGVQGSAPETHKNTCRFVFVNIPNTDHSFFTNKLNCLRRLCAMYFVEKVLFQAKK